MTYRKSVTCVAGFMLLVGLMVATQATRVSAAQPSVPYCVAEIEPLQHGQTESKVNSVVCSDTPLMIASFTTVIAIDYADPNYLGPTYTWTTSHANGCYDGTGYGAGEMPATWNDAVSSSQSFQGCADNRLWEHAYFSGASIRCNPCSSMGVMDNRTSSRQWDNQP